MYGFDPAQIRALSFKRFWNIIRLLTSYSISRFSGKLCLWGYPAVLSIEPASLCNLKCPQCPTGNGTLSRPQGFMDFGLYKKIIDATADYVVHLQLFFQGEPFINTALTRMIRYAKNRNIYTITSTNGHFLTPETIDGILQSGLDAIIIGLDGVTPEAYLDYRKNGAFDKVVQGISHLLDERRRRGLKRPKVYLQFIVMKHNESQIDTVKNFGRELGVDRVLLKSAQIYPGMNPVDFVPENERFSRYKIVDGKLVLNVPIPNRCTRVFSTAVFTWDGRMASCCFDKDADYSFGTFNGEPFLDLWKSEQGLGFRSRIFKDRKAIPICSNCTEGIKVFRK
ncbi:radical SAM/SPASM domain-containing protein [candidate division KSB1 bacterium]